MRIPKVNFVKSLSDVTQKPATILPEIAMVGRSNVGKSSMINSIFNQKHLAKTSSTPGKTQLINYFLVDESFYLVDLPGYGFSKVSKNISKKWEQLLARYLVDNSELKWVYLLVDSRHELMDIDRRMINWLTEVGIPFVVVLTKCDKLSNNLLNTRLKQFKSELVVVNILTYSAKLHKGRKEILDMFTNINFDV